ncbi:bifunctional DNA-formamidopyrimidine glycosylase/DNA-(apurinic or apyrimidinic site) lyase [Erythrobacteraceae bacterium CFH 75059]|uniref:bifunctional DNA-formamidopyrimidine glycosylase/DNA-(apurinic or apyrimidinic site) lyase n=1 Tax=Qipengyuania thermophila TaxID=2509361 RepID=UPI001020E9B8|nr:bifunctional DNA-formamidopyrimidine glycosylase/DNA-(apurinic or apyrimidinic site) lyase [Qipengyuania thermophila]TCD01917.1 bifunctional DNA-formamidopyrimidine glycosylase/DNA-(apurinic or apyrimidinic site) lyase [Erythrobacteraceae bacterium CFH 75059]
MPELPEVETTVRGLALHLDGRRIERVRVLREGLRYPFPRDLAARLTGARITGLGRRAKYGLIHGDRGDTLVFHLGMSGRWRIDPSAGDRHDHLLIEAEGRTFALNDPRRFGFVDLVGTEGLDRWTGFARLGPEPLGTGFTPAHLRTALSGRRQAIKLALLDQRIVAGLGNIYVCEALWHARVSPLRPAGAVSAAALGRVVAATRLVLEQSIAAGGSTLRDFLQPDGALGYFASRFSVYGREGEPCLRPRCGTVVRIVQGGRSTWHCPRCQR